MMREKVKLRGALGAIERRVAARRLEMNEFNESPPQAMFEATKEILPNTSWDGVVRKILEIRVATSYANVKGDNDEVHRMTEENAMRQLCSFLYEDVIHDLRIVMGELSAGKRNASMHLIGDLMRRLTGSSADGGSERG
jgi:hypothetical protein